ncbi:MAG: DUF1648 domain-containing protein [Candidatus Acidiferrum sp.]
MDSRLPKIVFLLLAISAGLYFASYYPLLPDVVASHFNVNGLPNGWQSKPLFFVFFVSASLIGVFLVFGVPWLVRRMPIEMVNLPNKRYWFGPEQLKATNEFVASWFAWLGCASFVVILLTFNYAVQSNLHPDRRPDPSHMSYPLLGFGAFTILWVIRALVRFGNAPQDGDS